MFFNLPTLLTWARIAAIPLIVAVFHWPGLTLPAQNALATAYFMKGNYKACEEQCLAIIKKEPAFAPAWNNLALAYFDQGEHAKAKEAAETAKKLGFEVPEGFLEELKENTD